EPTDAGRERTQARADRAACHAGERDGGRCAAVALPDARAAGCGAPGRRAPAALAPGSAGARSSVGEPPAPIARAPQPGGWGDGDYRRESASGPAAEP